MTYEEIRKQIRKDFYGIIQHKLNEGVKLLRKAVLKSTTSKLVRLKPMLFQSPTTQLKYCFLFYSIGKKDFKQNGALYIWFAYFYKDYGLYAFFTTGENNDGFSVYTPHFFDRYQERFLMDSSLERTEVMQTFFFNNPTANPIELENEKYPNCFFMSSKDGVQLGVKHPSGVLEVKTFLSIEQLKNDQIDIDNNNFEELQKYLIGVYGTDVMLK